MTLIAAELQLSKDMHLGARRPRSLLAQPAKPV